jgi:hypothetical protein
MALHMPFNSPEAKSLNIQIFEMIYHGVTIQYLGLNKDSYNMIYIWKVTPMDLASPPCTTSLHLHSAIPLEMAFVFKRG